MVATNINRHRYSNGTPFWRSSFVLLMLVLIAFTSSPAQSLDSLQRKWQFRGLMGGGISRFHVQDVPESPNYNSGEFLSGIRAKRSLGKRFALMSGLSVGIKVKRPSYFFYTNPPNRGLATREPAVELSLDHSASSKNSAYLSIPLALVAKINPSSFIYGGLNARVWFHRENEAPIPDVLSSLDEAGLLFGISNRITDRLNVGFECFIGLKDIHYSAVLMSGRFGELRVTNQSLVAFVSYTLWPPQ